MRYDLGDPNINLAKTEDGHVVSQRVMDLIEVIEDTWRGRLIVNWIPTRALEEGDQQFVIVEVLGDGREVPFMWIKDESEFTGEVLERIFLADNSKGNVFTRMQARNAALKSLQKKKTRDKMDEALDVMKHALKSPKNWYKMPKDYGGKVIKDYGNRSR